MTLVESLPKDENGQIEIPIAAKDEAGNVFSGTVDPQWINTVFGDYVNLTVPLSTEQFSSLKSKIGGLWPENWDVFHSQGII